MRSFVRHGTIAVALLGSLSAAIAQQVSMPPDIRHGPATEDRVHVKVKFTDQQRRTIADSVRKEGKALTPPPNFVASVGAPVPPAIELYILPDSALVQVPAAKEVKYTVVQNQLVLVDPTNMRVVEVIEK